MEGESEALLRAMTDSLKVSDLGSHPDGRNTTEQEDCFYDCEEAFHAESNSRAGQTTINHTETTQDVMRDQVADEGQHVNLQTDAPRGPVDTDTSDTLRPHKQVSEMERDAVLEGGVHDDQEKWEKIVEEEDKRADSDSEFKEETIQKQEFDEDYLLEVEKNLTEEEKESRRADSMTLKEKGNAQFKNKDHVDAEESYTAALKICPVCYSKDRSILFSNRAAARLHLDKKEEAISDCCRAIELNPNYVRAILRRAELYEKTDKLDEALEDYKTVLEKDPSIPTAREACMRLPRQIEERNEKMKEEMLSKLKDLGNMFLRPFGLSTSNFQVNQDQNTGSYSINFVQNPNNNNR
ncbi:tetratricopeptide repeat protein 1 [Pygocentrus nattereri]|uniref:Tetratricopeptide repeat protein 1 n=1 Tax=Pygocentrus nattereri TaxID=42514 RepID=A0A3B4C9P8_PYGNA|nr:tetratricopeptide repeat protein 1 [Pygocentrus nattereri]XP_017554176.1 tetratricopeptide repeat protein 1 [Pygocentrus nattereri]